MKKLIPAFVALAVLSLAGVVALSFGLRSLVAEQVLLALNSLSLSPDGRPCQSSVEHIDFAPLSRTLTLRGVSLRGQTPQGPVSYAAAEACCRLPAYMLLLFTPLRHMVLDATDMTPVAEDMVLRNLSLHNPTARTSIQRKEVDVVRVQSAFLLDALTRQKPVDMASAAFHISVDNARGFFVNMETPAKEGLSRLTIKETGLKGWRGATIDELRVEGLQVRVDGQDALRVASFVQSGITLPNEDLLRRLMAASDLGPQGTGKTMATIPPLLDEMLAAPTPVVRQVRATGLAFTVEKHTVGIRDLRLDWLANAPRHTSGVVTGLHIPAGLLSGFVGLAAPPLTADISFESLPQGPAARKEKGRLQAAGLGHVVYALTAHQEAAGKGPSPTLYSDLDLTFTDQGFLVWLARAMAPDPRLAAAALRMAATLPALPPTAQNAAVRTALQTFAARPGVLEVRSLPGRNFQLPQLLGVLADPGAFLTMNATPGKQSLEEQIRALGAAAPAKP